MPRSQLIIVHLSMQEVQQRFKACKDIVERQRWQAIMLKMQNRSSFEISQICATKPDWVRKTIASYNKDGPEGIRNKNKDNGRSPYLNDDELLILRNRLQNPPPEGGIWTGPKVAKWISNHIGFKVNPRLGWDYLQKLGFSTKTPRPTHPSSSEEIRNEFKKTLFKVIYSRSSKNIQSRELRFGHRMNPGKD